jgi:drug/metabolite transporter (DMT)-like permease
MKTSSSSLVPFARRSCAVPLAFGYMYVAWGCTYLATKCAIVDLPVLLMSGTRFFLAGLLLFGGVLVLDRAAFRRGTVREWADAARIGTLLLVLGIGTGNWAQQYINSSFCAMVFSALPLWIVVIDWLRPGGRAPTRMVAAGLLLGFAGVGLILAPQGTVGAHGASPAMGALLVLASIAWAAGAVFSRQMTSRGSALLPVARQMIVAGAVLLLLGGLHGDGARLHLATVRVSAWLGFGYLLLIGSTTGYPVYIWLMRTCPPSKVATIPYMNLLVAVAAGWAIGHETLTPRLLGGTGIVVVSVAIVLRAKVTSDAPAPLPALVEEPLPCRPEGAERAP